MEYPNESFRQDCQPSVLSVLEVGLDPTLGPWVVDDWTLGGVLDPDGGTLEVIG
jgi:hypothetical protein